MAEAAQEVDLVRGAWKEERGERVEKEREGGRERERESH